MRVRLAVQVLSESVVSLILRYVNDPDIKLEIGCDIKIYAPLKTIVGACRLIDIWNANYSKNVSVSTHLKTLT